MSKIEKLLKDYCPNGVEWKSLDSLGFLFGGLSGKTKSDFQDGQAKYISYKNIFSNISVNTTTNDLVKIGANEKQNEIKFGDVLFTGSSESKDECGMSSVLTDYCDEKLYLNSFSFGFRLFEEDVFLPGFLKYLFRDNNIRKQINSTASGVTRYNISKKRFGKIQIPIPPLPVQQEIVNILDKFTSLEARKTQYVYYRDKLLGFEGKDVEWKTLGEVCLKTSNIKWKDNIDKEFSYIDLSSVNRDNNKIEEVQVITSENAPSRAQQIVLTNDIIFGTTRPTLQRYSIIRKELNNQICSTGFCILRANENIVLPKFLFFILTTSYFYKYIENNQEGSAYPSISNTKVKNFECAIPPIEEQNRIVAILDKFDALVNDISTGLPAEIKARRQQYEYYRSKLLTFNSFV